MELCANVSRLRPEEILGIKAMVFGMWTKKSPQRYYMPSMLDKDKKQSEKAGALKKNK